MSTDILKLTDEALLNIVRQLPYKSLVSAMKAHARFRKVVEENRVEEKLSARTAKKVVLYSRNATWNRISEPRSFFIRVQYRNLRQLDLIVKDVEFKFCRIFAENIKIKSTEVFKLIGVELNDDVMDRLSNIDIDLSQLEELHLENCKVTVDDQILENFLAKLHDLKRIVITDDNSKETLKRFLGDISKAKSVRFDSYWKTTKIAFQTLSYEIIYNDNKKTYYHCSRYRNNTVIKNSFEQIKEVETLELRKLLIDRVIIKELSTNGPDFSSIQHLKFSNCKFEMMIGSFDKFLKKVDLVSLEIAGVIESKLLGKKTSKSGFLTRNPVWFLSASTQHPYFTKGFIRQHLGSKIARNNIKIDEIRTEFTLKGTRGEMKV